MAASGNAGFWVAVVSRRAAFRRWRRACPFWGGFLLLLAGIELLLIPLSGIFIHGAVKLVVYIGIGGVFGVLLGVLLIACGLLLWLNPAHRTFYAIAGVLLAVLSFIASNFGGFFIGMLLGIIGGSMGFGWKLVRGPARPPAAGSATAWRAGDGGRRPAAAACEYHSRSARTRRTTRPPSNSRTASWGSCACPRRRRARPRAPGPPPPSRGLAQPRPHTTTERGRRVDLGQPVQVQDRRWHTRRRSIHRDVSSSSRRGLRHPGRLVVPGHDPGTHGQRHRDHDEVHHVLAHADRGSQGHGHAERPGHRDQ